MSLFVDTSVWSLALRRDGPPAAAPLHALVRALQTGETVVATGLVLQELLQGFSGPKDRDAILDRFAALAMLHPDRDDHIEAALLRITADAAVSRLGRSMLCWRDCASGTT